ncbi:ArnT family glycosyltransferase [Kitasatospora sp. NPDC006697]|uniref:ArnT family glycosyltransferase n=1 Tax=Kitasatospora sp. NPDC006697 TaxID=3364020 RepID=UPI0036B65361
MATTVLPIAPEPESNRRTPRRAPWRSPADQPGYTRPALLAIAALAGLLFFWGIDRSSYHTFYADAVRSMTESWKAFVFGSYDPAGTITLDKLPGFLWPQAVSARLLGFHPWALALPQAVEGVLSVLVLFRAVRRWAGANAALLAALSFTLTPVVAGLFRTAVEDPLFTLLLLLAADATQRAARTGRLRTLVLAGVWVGVAFQAKMLEAWAVLPALAGVYLLAAPVRLRRRLAHLLAAGAVTLAVSASWVLLATATPAGDRPYIDGTTDNSAYSMVVGYNFLNRFTSVGLNAAETGSVTSSRGGGQQHGARDAAARPQPRPGGDGGWTKMFGAQFAPQTGWLYPLAATALLCALVWRRREPRTDPLRAGYLLWGGWLAVYFLVFSAGSVGGHSYYMGVIATPLAALAGAGLVLLRQGQWVGGARAWALPAAVAGTALWSAHLAGLYPSFLPWLPPATLVLGGLAVVLPAAGRGARRLARAGLAAALGAVLLAPGAWAASVLDSRYGNSGMGTVGPQAAHGYGRPAAPTDGARAAAGGGGSTLSRSQQRILAYAEAHDQGARYLFATTTWTASSPYILATGKEVLPMGGFTGEVPSPTLPQFQALVRSGRLHFVLLGSPQGGRSTAAGPTAAVTDWVRRNCAPVAPGDYGQSVTSAAPQLLYRCTA